MAAISVVPLPPLTAQHTVTGTGTSRVRPVDGPVETPGGCRCRRTYRRGARLTTSSGSVLRISPETREIRRTERDQETSVGERPAWPARSTPTAAAVASWVRHLTERGPRAGRSSDSPSEATGRVSDAASRPRGQRDEGRASEWRTSDGNGLMPRRRMSARSSHADLATQVAERRTELAALRAELATEVRTRRLVVVDEAGEERVTTRVGVDSTTVRLSSATLPDPWNSDDLDCDADRGTVGHSRRPRDEGRGSPRRRRSRVRPGTRTPSSRNGRWWRGRLLCCRGRGAGARTATVARAART